MIKWDNIKPLTVPLHIMIAWLTLIINVFNLKTHPDHLLHGALPASISPSLPPLFLLSPFFSSCSLVPLNRWIVCEFLNFQLWIWIVLIPHKFQFNSVSCILFSEMSLTSFFFVLSTQPAFCLYCFFLPPFSFPPKISLKSSFISAFHDFPEGSAPSIPNLFILSSL